MSSEMAVGIVLVGMTYLIYLLFNKYYESGSYLKYLFYPLAFIHYLVTMRFGYELLDGGGYFSASVLEKMWAGMLWVFFFIFILMLWDFLCEVMEQRRELTKDEFK